MTAATVPPGTAPADVSSATPLQWVLFIGLGWLTGMVFPAFGALAAFLLSAAGRSKGLRFTMLGIAVMWLVVCSTFNVTGSSHTQGSGSYTSPQQMLDQEKQEPVNP